MKAEIAKPISTLNEACKLLGWQGGTLQQAKDAIIALQPMERHSFLAKLEKAVKEDRNAYMMFLTEYSPLRVAHIQFSNF